MSFVVRRFEPPSGEFRVRFIGPEPDMPPRVVPGRALTEEERRALSLEFTHRVGMTSPFPPRGRS